MNDITRFNKLVNPERRGEYKIESLAKTKDEILFLCNFHTETTAATAFYTGERLKAMRAQLEHGKFIKYLEKEFPYSRRTASQYVQLYEHYKGDPAEMQKFGLRQALMHAGIIKPKERKIIPFLPNEHYGDHKRESDLSAFFDAPPLNENAKLEKYRFRIQHGEVCIIEKGYHQPVPVAEIYIPGEADSRLNSDHRELMQNIQRLLEKYYEKVEYTHREDEKRAKILAGGR